MGAQSAIITPLPTDYRCNQVFSTALRFETANTDLVAPILVYLPTQCLCLPFFVFCIEIPKIVEMEVNIRNQVWRDDLLSKAKNFNNTDLKCQRALELIYIQS